MGIKHDKGRGRGLEIQTFIECRVWDALMTEKVSGPVPGPGLVLFPGISDLDDWSRFNFGPGPGPWTSGLVVEIFILKLHGNISYMVTILFSSYYK